MMEKCNSCGHKEFVELELDAMLGTKVQLVPKGKILGKNIGLLATICTKCGVVNQMKADNIQKLNQK